jgi:hypothetical protein
LSTAYVHEIFRNLESGDGKGFFDHVADDVDWIVEGTHPLAGHYHSKAEFLAHTFEKLAKVLPQGTQLHVEHALVHRPCCSHFLGVLKYVHLPVSFAFNRLMALRSVKDNCRPIR